MYDTMTPQGSSTRTSDLKKQVRHDGFVNTLAVRFRNLRRRRKIARLEALDDSLLADIGLLRSDLTWARHLDLSRNPLQELNQIARQRSSEYRRSLAHKAAR